MRQACSRSSNIIRLSVMAVMAISTLAACGGFKDIFSPGMDDSVLPGVRESVIRTGNKLDISDISKVPVVIPPAYVNAEWTQPGGVASNAPQHISLRNGLKRIWSKGAGKGSSNDGRLTSVPIIAGGRAFVLDTRATVRAFNAQNGARNWTRRLTPKGEEDDEGFGGGLAYDAGKLIAAIGFGNVVALDPASGKVLWTRDVGVPIRAAPTAADGRVFVIGINNQVFALSLVDGSSIWTFRGAGANSGLISNSSPAVADGIVVVPFTTGDLMAFKVDSGAVVWSDSLTLTGRLSSLSSINVIAARPVIYRGRVIAISHSGRLAANDLKTGKRLWSRNFPSTQTPWAAGDYIFFINADNILMAIAHADGKIRWIKRLGSGRWNGPVLAGNRLIVVNDKGKIINISPHTGTEISSQGIGEKIMITPIVAANTLYLLNDSAELIAMR